MRHVALSLALLALALPAAAADKPHREPSAAQRAQYEKMRQCNVMAKEKALRGDPRKAFMKDCLSKHPAA